MDALSDLKNRRLSAVTFVQNYVQLEFDGLRLTAFLWPILKTGGAQKDVSTPGYRDLLCSHIGELVSNAYTVPGTKLVIEFEDGTMAEISLSPDDQVGPEAAMLSDSKKPISVWRAGDY
jgi:hypothetical protein